VPFRTSHYGVSTLFNVFDLSNNFVDPVICTIIQTNIEHNFVIFSVNEFVN